MANDGYLVVKALQQRGVDCDLYVDIPQHIASYPQWEDCDIITKEKGPNSSSPSWEAINKDFTIPKWLKFVDITRGTKFSLPSLVAHLPFFPEWKVLWAYRNFMRKVARGIRFEVYKRVPSMMQKYDLIVPHVPYSLYAMKTGKPYIPFDAGLIRNFVVRDSIYQEMRMELLEESYRLAPLVFATNIDTFDLYRKLGINNFVFMPFLIDTDRYKPLPRKLNLPYEHIVFHPARFNWAVKGNYRLIRAYAQFHKEHHDSLLVLVDWGTSADLKQAHDLVHRLWLDKHVKWLGLLNKPQLIHWFNESTVVADQFVLKGAGTTVNEAMACAKPVIISLAPECALEAYGEVPPTLLGNSEETIFQELVNCTDPGFCKKVGDAGRLWELKHHSPDVVSQLHIDAYKKVLEKA